MNLTTTSQALQRVVVTGMGIVSPVGSTLASAWENILASKSGIRPISDYDASALPVQFCGTVQGFDSDAYFSGKEARKMGKFIQYGMAAGIQAIEDAGLDFSNETLANNTALVVGSGIGGLPGILSGYKDFLDRGIRRVSPFYVPANIINMISGNLSIRYGIKGPNLAISTACASATHSIAQAYRMLQYGDAEVAIAGGAEMSSNDMGIAGFAAAKALSTRNDNPEAASRPWDKDRDGFVLSDGAGILVLETLAHAKARNANIYGEIIGVGMSGDAYHITATHPEGHGAARCITQALKNARVNASDVDYINAHGTSTKIGDLAETQAIKTSLGEDAYRAVVSSTKSMTGHALGAAGGFEAVFTLLALHEGKIPPTINLDNPDDGCDLDYCPKTARDANLNVALSNSFGFGGTNATLVFRRI